MSVANGPDLIAALRSIEPGVAILGITGRLERAGGLSFESLNLSAVLNKPFSGPELLQALDAMLQRSAVPVAAKEAQ